MKKDAMTINFMHHFALFISFVYYTKTFDMWNSFGIMALSVFIGYFLDE